MQLQVTGFIDIYVSLNRVVQPRQASVRELSAFHSLDYIECLEQVTNDDKCEEMEHVASEYGLGMIHVLLNLTKWAYDIVIIWPDKWPHRKHSRMTELNNDLTGE